MWLVRLRIPDLSVVVFIALSCNALCAADEVPGVQECGSCEKASPLLAAVGGHCCVAKPIWCPDSYRPKCLPPLCPHKYCGKCDCYDAKCAPCVCPPCYCGTGPCYDAKCPPRLKIPCCFPDFYKCPPKNCSLLPAAACRIAK